MAAIDVTITDPQYNQLVSVLQAWQDKLEPLRGPLRRVLASDPQRAKLVAFLNSNDGRLLKTTKNSYLWLKQFMEDIGWEEA